MSRKAFLVGINNFPQPEWCLQGCINDTLAVQALLQSYFGFSTDDFQIVHDAQATAQAIRDGLAWLIQGSQPGDVRVFHFSSHGTQVADQVQGDELDAVDEVIVPYDHDWDHPFRDDDLGAVFETIPPGVNFTFIADCCHSGTIQREILERGIEFKPRFLLPPQRIRDNITRLRAQRDLQADTRLAQQLADLAKKTPPDQLAAKMQEYIAALRKQQSENRFGNAPAEHHFLLAACQDRQTAADARIGGEFHGAFTWGLTESIKEANGDLTYEEALRRASARMGEYAQVPQLECPPGVKDWKLFAPLV